MDPVIFRDRIIEKSLELGADDAGVCLASDLLRGPTHRKFTLPEGLEDHHSVLVIALRHPVEEPELDYFVKREGFRFGNSEGNRRLMEVSREIGLWFEEEGITSRDLHYYVERGGVFLKGAAVLAGLGTIGFNNMLINPQYGARIRFRAHLIDAPLKPSVPLRFDPCSACPMPCLEVCPAGALDREGYSSKRCQDRFDHDYEQGTIKPAEGDQPASREVRYCRDCEFACTYLGTLEAG